MGAEANASLTYDILVGQNALVDNLAMIEKEAMKVGRTAANSGERASIAFKDVNGHLIEGTAQAEMFGKVASRGMKLGAQGASKFDARLLSLLFSGMALNRLFGGAFRSIVNSFQKAEDDTSGLSQATTRLGAAWEFLKFSLFDALNTPFFIGLIDGVIGAINWFSQLGSGAKISLLVIIGGLALLGIGLMAIAQITLAWNAIFGVGGFLANVSLMNGKLFGSAGLMTKLQGIATAGFIFGMGMDLVDFLKGKTTFTEAVDDMATKLGIIGAINGSVVTVVIALAFKLAPFAKQIDEAGQKLQEKAAEKFKEPSPFGTGEVNPNILPALGYGVSGSFLVGLGNALKPIDAMIDAIDEATKGAEPLIKSQDKIGTSSEELAVTTDDLNTAIETTGNNMDVVAGEVTTNYNDAIDSRIKKLDEETAAIERRNKAEKSGGFSGVSSFLDQASSYGYTSPTIK